MSEAFLHESVSVEIVGLNLNEFLDYAFFQRFLATISTLNPNWLPEDVNVFSAQEFHSNENYSINHIDVGKSKYIPRLNVSFFVSKSEDQAFT